MFRLEVTGAGDAFVHGMKLPVLSVDDRQWMIRRLARTVWLAVALIALNFVSAFAFKPNASTSYSRVVDQIPLNETDSQAVSTTSTGSGRRFNAVPPVGWRKTNRGWEHVSTWTIRSESINSLIESQAAREPALARGLLAKVSKFSPVTFAIYQIAAIIAIAAFVKLVSRRPLVRADDSAVKRALPVKAIDG